MKKLALIVVLAIVTVAATAQKVVYSNQSNYGTWNELEMKWDWGTTMYEVLKFTITDYTITVNDKAESVYRIFENLPDDWENMMQWTMTTPYQLD